MDDPRPGRALPAGVYRLFADGGNGRTLNVPLPEGAVVWPDRSYRRDHPVTRPAFWLSDAPVTADVWRSLAAEHPYSGLWPLLLDETAQPWAAGQIAPEPETEIDVYEPAQFMAEVWQDMIEPRLRYGDDFEDLAPFGKFCPGLAAPGEPMAEPHEAADWLAGRLADGRSTLLGLVAATRSADSLAVMGWQGALNHNPWTAPMAAVARGWEDRFGARLVRVGFNTMDFSVAAPPRDAEHAVHVAAEHWAFCPDVVVQGAGTLEGYAAELVGRNAWSFWWD
ncbi:uncharacterized protein DUF4253 [Actinocorallia herbida]|uniref:Uncharacterized protein DUF4253 n=1 Tax=Actinocorallia herbida TaxID=58109 RepID=A0A3N1D4B5_9ACTN|nr:DUF4253 domain-containing protein [Actinocorallia herbida]ROO88383.1 uncharacterized protein DUF4253 [Actinocorallia herbida]